MNTVAIDYPLMRQRVSLLDFLESLGHTAKREGDTWRLKCPLHHGKTSDQLKVRSILATPQNGFCP